MNRRHFIRLCGKALAALGLASLFPKREAEAAAAIQAPRQIIARDMTCRTIMWDAPSLFARAYVEIRAEGAAQRFDAAYDWSELQGEGRFHYAAAIPELKPNTAYTYRIILGDAATDWLPLSAGAGEDAPFEALIFADSQCTDFSILRDFLQKAFRRHPNAAFFAIDGDLVDNGELPFYWTSFLAAISPYASRLPFVPVMGNHECYGADWKNALPAGYLAAFAVPENGSTRFRRYYYSFDYGAVHFIVLNTQFQELDALRPGLHLEELSWLKADCAASKKPWKVVLMHKDVLAYDEYQPGTGQTGGISDVGNAFMASFDALGVDLVLTGHMHTYRNRGHIFAKKPSEHGPVYVMSGPAGDQRYFVPPDRAYDRHPMDQSDVTNFRNYLVLKADVKTLATTCYQEDGTAVDSVKLEKPMLQHPTKHRFVYR